MKFYTEPRTESVYEEIDVNYLLNRNIPDYINNLFEIEDIIFSKNYSKNKEILFSFSLFCCREYGVSLKDSFLNENLTLDDLKNNIKVRDHNGNRISFFERYLDEFLKFKNFKDYNIRII